MSKTDKLKEKLANGTIDAREARTLLSKLGWTMSPGKGSHEKWTDGTKILILATHSKELKPYQIKQIQEAIQ
jgi:predicted RNA binding protein YcfA (HicA-like mRNA interferase family)